MMTINHMKHNFFGEQVWTARINEQLFINWTELHAKQQTTLFGMKKKQQSDIRKRIETAYPSGDTITIDDWIIPGPQLFVKPQILCNEYLFNKKSDTFQTIVNHLFGEGSAPLEYISDKCDLDLIDCEMDLNLDDFDDVIIPMDDTEDCTQRICVDPHSDTHSTENHAQPPTEVHGVDIADLRLECQNCSGKYLVRCTGRQKAPLLTMDLKRLTKNERDRRRKVIKKLQNPSSSY